MSPVFHDFLILPGIASSSIDRIGLQPLVEDNILVGTDESAEGRHAVWAAQSVAPAAANLTILRVVPLVAKGEIPSGRLVSSDVLGLAGPGHPELDRLMEWVGPDLRRTPAKRAELAVAFGVPGIEIGRLAVDRNASLIVLGRQARGPERRLLLGETADAVVRRSDRPVLFVPTTVTRFQRIAVAIDATERAASVLEAGLGFGRRHGMAVTVVTVEPELDDDQSAARATMPRARAVRIAETIRRVPGAASLPVVVRHGNAIEEVLAYVEETAADILVVGYRRGGPPKIVGPTEIARNLLYATSRAVLTIPL